MRTRLAVLLILLGAATLVVGFVSSTAWLLYASLVCSALAAVTVLLGPRRAGEAQRAEPVGRAEDDGRSGRRGRGARKAGRDEDSRSWAALLGEGEAEEEPATRTRRVPAVTGASRSGVASVGDGLPAQKAEAEEWDISSRERPTPPDGLEAVPAKWGVPDPAEADARVGGSRSAPERVGGSRAAGPERVGVGVSPAPAGAAGRGVASPADGAAGWVAAPADRAAEPEPVAAPPEGAAEPVPPPPDGAAKQPLAPSGEYPFPIEDYDDLSVAEILPLLPELDDQELVDVLLREQRGPNRVAVISRIDALLEGDG